jgi:hypothetical protein
MNGYCLANDIDRTLRVDIMKNDFSVFIELKNKHNTMNSSSRESTLRKLININKKYPRSICLIGIINGNNYVKKINKHPCIYEYSGEELFKLILNDADYYTKVTNIIENNLDDWVAEYKLIKNVYSYRRDIREFGSINSINTFRKFKLK